MFSIVDTIKNKVGSGNYYLIGIDQSNGEDPSLIYHEIAHGLWFSSPKYKSLQTLNIDAMDPRIKDILSLKISEMGYGENVIDDEIQAYLSTGISDDMIRIKGIKEAEKSFKNVFDGYSNNIRPINKKRIV
jgi:hypothetical protein